MKKYLKCITRNGIMINKKFWTTIKPLLKNELIVTSNGIPFKQGEYILNDEVKIVKILNNAYMNVVEKTGGKRPVSVLDLNNLNFYFQLIFFKENPNSNKTFYFVEVITVDALKLRKRINISIRI